MVYRNEFDKDGKSQIDGERAENNFVRIFTERFGIAPIKASDYDNKVKHIDYYMKIPAKDGIHKASVDVKSWKHKEDCVDIEFITYGKLGWLYGEADFIGFETPDEQSFVMVDRKSLMEYVERHVNPHFTTDRLEREGNIYVRFKNKFKRRTENGEKQDEDDERYDCTTVIERDILYSLRHWVLKI